MPVPRRERPPVQWAGSVAVIIKKRRRILFIVVFLAAVVSVAAIVIIGIRKESGKSLLKIMSDRVDLQVRNVHYTEVGDSGMKWEITADAARYQKKENLAFFDKPAVKLVMKDGKAFVMTGDHGRFNTESRDMEIEGNVGIVSENGDRFTTDRLRYRNAEKMIETDRPVAMENKSVRVSGVGMIVSLEGKKVDILSQVRARLAGGIGEKK
jgi:LPS export ABC transporter protein LptC